MRRLRETQYLFNPKPKLLEQEFMFDTKTVPDEGSCDFIFHSNSNFVLETPASFILAPHDLFLDNHIIFIDSRVYPKLPTDVIIAIKSAGGAIVTSFNDSVTCVVLHDRLCPEYQQVRLFVCVFLNSIYCF